GQFELLKLTTASERERVMTDRIAELRALMARLQTDENPYAQFEALLIAEQSLPALLDCAEALRDLLQDTQHAEHECDDEVFCPVKNGRAALRALDLLYETGESPL